MENQAIKDFLAFPLSLHMAYDKADADGKIDVNDLTYLLEPVTKLIPAVQNAKAALDQVRDLDEAERADVNAWAKSTYDIADDQLEEKIEAGIDVLLSVAVLVGKLTKEEAQALRAA